MLRQITQGDLTDALRTAHRVDTEAMTVASEIVEDVRHRGEPAVRELALRFGDLDDIDAPIVYTDEDLGTAIDRCDPEDIEVLERAAARIRHFAEHQRRQFVDGAVDVPGGTAGYRWVPIETAGAYAPGGRYPLPSSVLMTVVPGRVAGTSAIWVASPRPTDITLAAAAVAGADGLLSVGGAQAIAAMTFGTFGPRADLLVGPGNRFVTAAKKYLFGEVGIDGLAGPSEVLVIADGSAEPDMVAADLLAQAEHDTDAVPMLITTSESMLDEVEQAITKQLGSLPTADIAGKATGNGFAVVAPSIAEAALLSDRIAPEHLSIHTEDARTVAAQCTSYGSVFIGDATTEAFADYGAGPNHVLPTAGSARFQSGLSVATFMRSPTWLQLDDPDALIDDTVALARLEGLEAHARSAERRAGVGRGGA